MAVNGWRDVVCAWVGVSKFSRKCFMRLKKEIARKIAQIFATGACMHAHAEREREGERERASFHMHPRANTMFLKKDVL